MEAPEPKNIVICLDGTGNQIEENLSNVLKLYRTLEKNDEQLVFYDQGVGTLGQVRAWGRRWQEFRNILGLAFGLGLDGNVLKAYEFIVAHYAESGSGKATIRDRIFIFGFSRGAHTARVLAGLIYEIGILRPEQIHLAGAALTAYKQSRSTSSGAGTSGGDGYEGEGANFRRVAGTRTGSVTFLGVFDTVSSVLVPNAGGLWPPLVSEKLPHTLSNPAVRTFRHAISIDERRRMFRPDDWEQGQRFQPNIHSRGTPDPQDAVEMWFSGYHSDVGGGHARKDSGISQFPLIWMIQEAKSCGLAVFDRMADYVTGIRAFSSSTEYLYPAPDAAAKLHDSMSVWWRLLEYVPKSVHLRQWPGRRSFLGWYLPLSEPRHIPANARIHPSVRDRTTSVAGYRPGNLRGEGAERRTP
ncbi:uncharacterized protein (DUF2235 family) [Hoeflea marina]|uniref:Uncharacterized protein (DUF2235 family) n=1 Tax=Hoeflea marina TaxID=274592 RepID=A0A317PSA3_9HYPH|nr:DUF2235 domain-containing protein [Hoeflea marina]PWW04039.1 uncharacterized protein (DUF2235 family) [Hoeflea marina]